MCSTLIPFEVVAIGPGTVRRVLTVLADDGQDAIDRLYRSERLHDDEIPVTCRPAGRRVMLPKPLPCGAPQPDGTVIVMTMSSEQRRQLYRWLAISAALPMAAMLAVHWLTA
jgi:hypothetical protein